MRSATTRSAAALVLGLGITVATMLAPDTALAGRSSQPQAILETAVVIVGTLVAVLAYGRFRRAASVADLCLVCAIAILAWLRVVFYALPDLIAPDQAGPGAAGDRLEVWGAVVARALGGAYLLGAAVAIRPLGRGRSGRRVAIGIVLAPLLLGAAAIALLALCGPAPPAVGVEDRPFGPWPSSPASVAQLLDAVPFFVAALLLWRRAATDGDSFLSWIGAGTIFGGFAMVDYALFSPPADSWLRLGDVVRAAALATWGLGVASELIGYWSGSAEAARRQARLMVALDLHDGLAQELALLSSQTYAPPEERASAAWHEELQRTAGRALGEARRAIASLADEEAPIDAELRRVDAVPGTAGMEVSVSVDVTEGSQATFDALEREAIVRIVREAVTNAVRHGRASHLQVRFEGSASPVLRVLDDGEGFDPATADPRGHLGIAGMREHAAALGASFAVRSAPGAGTMVEVQWPSE